MTETKGVVLGLPSNFLRVEAIALFAFSIWLFANQGLSWWLYPTLFFAPDVFMVGYVRNTSLGAFFYNIGHSTPLSLIAIVMGFSTGTPFLIGIGAIWLGHIGFDRALGYGLKYKDSFKHTHLSDIK